MEESMFNKKGNQQDYTPRPRKDKRIYLGLGVIGLGVWWLLSRMDIAPMPDWLFTWPVLLMLIGVFQLISSDGKRTGGYITLLVGAIFFIKYQGLFPEELAYLFWPIVVIGIGIFIFFKAMVAGKRKLNQNKSYSTSYSTTDIDSSEVLDATVILGGTTREFIAKSFKGGEITCIMGGAEIYLDKSDIQGNVHIDATCIMGGLKLVVPKEWEIQVSTTNIMGGVDDKRINNTQYLSEAPKKLTISGTIIMGGIDLQAY